MSLLSRWSAIRPYTISYRAFQLSGNPLSPGQVRNASLSAIHRGLRRSERAGFRNDRTSRPSRKQTAAEPRLDAFEQRFSGAIGRPGGRERHYKPKKAAQKMQGQEEEGGRKSRSKRFNDPEFSFGKRSLVYQLNRGEMKDKISKLLHKEGSHDEDTSNRFATRQNSSAWRENFGGERLRDQGHSGFRAGRSRPDAGRSNSMERLRDQGNSEFRAGRPRPDIGRSNFMAFRDRARKELGEVDATPRQRGSDTGRSNFMAFRDKARKELEEDDATPRQRGSRHSDDASETNRSTDFPISIQYTTAASQFLFGRSVVKAALRNPRRKLYNLYVQTDKEGNRSDGSKTRGEEDTQILGLARRKRVKITDISSRDQKLLDKMSKGRPHNGLVLEASPLPQLPTEGLGPKSSEPHGYGVTVAYQSKEDLAINGATGFIPCKPDSARPLVLLLNEILDPGNLGAILRSARFLGVSAVAITNRTSSAITSTVLKAAAGAAEELMLFSVEDPAKFLEASQEAGWISYAAVAPDPVPRQQHRQWTPDTIEAYNPLMSDPCILVLGNEGEGLPRVIRRTASRLVTIPHLASASDMWDTSTVDSLNVSVAAALLCHSFLRGTAPKQSWSFTGKLLADGRKTGGGESLF